MCPQGQIGRPTLSAPRPLAHVYDAAYTGVPNWDIGRPQQAFVKLLDAGYVRSPVLDVGCGTGELSMFLADHGHRVLGIDLSPVAVSRAKDKAHWRRVTAQFLVWDALNLAGLHTAGLSFRTVVDSAMFHILADAERDRFVAGLETVLDSGGLYCVLGDAPRSNYELYGITPQEITTRFRKANGWEVAFIYPTVFERRWSSNNAYFVGVRRR